MELIVLLMLSGLVVGALGRFALPGPNPMSLWVTMLIGIVASIVTGVIIAALGLPDRLGFVAAVLCAAGIVYLVNGRPSLRRRDHV